MFNIHVYSVLIVILIHLKLVQTWFGSNIFFNILSSTETHVVTYAKSDKKVNPSSFS